ncbi:hypothetical protein ON010_g17545 [Phytophthora cinnamomi]|nr:hypothetical protein ON010_g17545 [Phytophthora cinnamomi]
MRVKIARHVRVTHLIFGFCGSALCLSQGTAASSSSLPTRRPDIRSKALFSTFTLLSDRLAIWLKVGAVSSIASHPADQRARDAMHDRSLGVNQIPVRGDEAQEVRLALLRTPFTLISRIKSQKTGFMVFLNA